jgi:hypothetical protein
MINPNIEFAFGLFLLFLAVLIFVALILGAPILGILRSIKFSKKTLTGIKDERFKDFSDPKVATRIRWSAILALVSMFGFLLLFTLMLLGILPLNSKMTISVIAICGLTSVLAGSLIYKEVLKRVSK